MGKEASAALDFSFNVLKDDTTLAPLITDQTGVHIYQRQAPAGVWNLTDYYVFGSIMSPGSDFIGGFGVRLMTDPLLLWYAVKNGSDRPEVTRHRQGAGQRLDQYPGTD
jgi:hypothetical protein